MRAVLQKVESASVSVDETTVGKIDKGILILLGIKEDDTESQIDYIVDKSVNLRIFEDENDKMNLSLKDVRGSVLLVSQFTLYADCRKGRRPGFTEAAKPEQAKKIYEQAIQKFKHAGLQVETGQFQSMMKVSLINDGPVTIILDTNDQKNV